VSSAADKSALSALARANPERHQTGAQLSSPAIHLPSATAPTHDVSGGYTLPTDTDMGQLQRDIVTAMTDGSFLTVQTRSVPGGALVLSGATLAYAVLCLVAGTG
jgi:hypothetical protein